MSPDPAPPVSNEVKTMNKAKRTQRNETILIVEDEKLLRWSLKERLGDEGFSVQAEGDGRGALEALEKNTFDLILLDFRLPDTNGLKILAVVREKYQDIPVILMTAFSSIETAVEAMRLGAFNYIKKPFDQDELLIIIEKALEDTKLRRELRHFRKQQNNQFGLENIVADSPLMQKVFETALKVASSPATTVLITGESGVGKDLLAQAIHARSDRAEQPFMNITCTTLTESLLESELFGHEKGAFTDAKARKKGLFELAHMGTVFLDEIGDMPPALQAKLLRVLQEKTFRRVGGRTDVTVDVRIIAATNRNLKQLVKEGGFREDLYYRLNVIEIELPPLRDRLDDVPLLAQHFISIYNKKFRKNVHGIRPEAISQLLSYSWPGNVRELKNVIERAIILGNGQWVEQQDFLIRREVPIKETQVTVVPGDFILPDEGLDLKALEIDLIRQALKKTRGVKSKAGALLGMNRDQIRYRMKTHNIVYEP